jgi:ATP-binding cassette subfamily B protein
MFNKFMNLSAGFHADNFGGSLVSQTTKLTHSYVRLADGFIFQLYGLIVSVVFVSIALYKTSPLFVWGLIGFSALFIYFNILLSERVRKLGASEASAQNKTTGYLADAITNVLAIKSFSTRNYEKDRFNKATENTRGKTVALMWGTLKVQLFSSTITSSVLVMAALVAIIAVTVYGANPSVVFLMFTFAAFIGDSLWEFSSSTLRNYNRSIGDSREAVATLVTEPSVEDPKKPEKNRIKKGNIEFKNVVFDHESQIQKDDESLFDQLNFSVKSGERIGLVGHSGGGKTTITKLLLRFMDIDGGEILIDGQNIAKISQDNLRSSITYVPQEPLLFHRTLSENISYGNPAALEKEITKVAQAAHAHEFIEKLPKRYETLVGERGVKLSGGQRQRVAIARAMLKNAPILLLDEATSALDSESEKLIQDALWKLMEGKTAIVIAHRLSTVQKMDRIIVIENGQVVEEGSHKELLKNDGIYAELWKHQSGGFLED